MVQQLSTYSFLIATLWAFLCSAVVYRADSRSPDTIKAAGGFVPKGLSSPGTVSPDLSLWNHVNGADSGFSREDDGYVSTSTSRTLANSWAINNLGASGYVYVIQEAPNMIDCQATLMRYNPFPDEMEYAAIGGIHWAQVIGWSPPLNGGLGDEVANADYNGAVYGALTGAGGVPQLAAFPDGHPAWNEAPWNQYATCSNSKERRSARDLMQRQSCSPTESNVAVGTQYMGTVDAACGGTCP